MPLPVIFGSLFLSGGVLLVIKAFQARSRRLALLDDCVRVVGKVIRHDDTTSEGDVSVTWAPVVQYTVAGKEYELALLPTSDTSKHKVGTRVPVFYHRPSPAHAVERRQTWDVNFMCVAAFLPLLFGVVLFVGQYIETSRANATSSPSTRP